VLKADITTGLSSAQVRINDISLTIQQIALGFIDASQPAFQIGDLTVSGGSFDLGARSISVSSLELMDGIVDVIRDNDKTLNLVHLFASKKPDQEISEKLPQTENSKPWQFNVDAASLSGFKTRISDLTVKPDSPLIELDKIGLTVARFDGKSPFPFEISLNVVQGGELTASGKIDPSGAAVESDITIKDLAMPIFEPYLSRTTDITLNSGLFSATGTFDRGRKGDICYQGEVGIADLQIIENSTMDSLLGWEQLKTYDLLLKLNPNRLEIDTLNLIGLEGKFIISEDNKVNVVEAFRTKEGSSSIKPQPEGVDQEKGGETFPVNISKLRLDNGILDFADLSLRPQFATKIYELNGTITGISSLPGARTQVELNGRVDEYGSSDIKGEINSFNPKQFTDISVVFRNVDMTNLTPYSGKFAGYKIDSGKLSMELQYKIKDSQLLGENKIVIETLVLGEKVESSDAVKLPLRLAVALLRDSNGVIDIDLPVSGNLDDPEFRYGPLIWKALVNLLSKIVTSPFRLLGSLFGSGEEETLDKVRFDPGEDEIPPPEQEKLAKLFEALRQRPQLTLVVTGCYNSDSDGEVIRELQIRRALAETSGTAPETGEDPGHVDFSNPKTLQRLAALFVGRYGQEEYDKLTAEMSAAERPSDTKQTAEDPSALGKLLYSGLVKREQVEQSSLVKLADERAQAIAAYLTGLGGILSERIIIKPSERAGSGDQISSKLDLDAE
jgi:outer membrane protein OmpA-like peptidoglycan-associated protein